MKGTRVSLHFLYKTPLKFSMRGFFAANQNKLTFLDSNFDAIYDSSAMTALFKYKNWLKSHLPEIKKEYFEFLRFRSISADPAYKKEMAACAEWLKNYIAEKTDLKAELIPTDGYPLVYAESKFVPKAKTLLIYGHYDVQPVDPLDLWKSDPFEPVEREGKIFARGAVDDKGQIFYAIVA